MNRILTRGLFYLLLVLFCFTSCDKLNSLKNNNSSSETTGQDLELEKERLELEKEKLKLKEQQLEMERSALSDEKRKEDAIRSARRDQQFETGQECVVITDRSYFHNKPDQSTRRKAYLVRGDRIYPLRARLGFVYIEFYNPELNKSTNGWVSMNDITPVE